MNPLRRFHDRTFRRAFIHYDRNFLYGRGLKSPVSNSESAPPLHKKRISRPWTKVKNSISGGPGPRRAADRVGQAGIRPSGDRPIPSPRRRYSYSPLSSAALMETRHRLHECCEAAAIRATCSRA
jgi:hypothetical protein